MVSAKTVACAPVSKQVSAQSAFKASRTNVKPTQATAVSSAIGSDSKPTVKRAPYDIFTLTTWLLKEERQGHIDSELATVIASIAFACKQIASLVNRAGISNLTGVAGNTNVQGEDQKKLDVISNDVFKNCLAATGRTGVLASEEEDNPVMVEETSTGHYIVVFDPLDGSSNIDAGISVGSIFGVYEPADSCPISDLSDDPNAVMEHCVLNVLQPGRQLKCSGYALYSSSTVLVITVGTGVYGFTLDPLVGEFVLTHPNVKIPEKGKIYSFNEGNYDLWAPHIKEYIDSLKKPENWGGKPYSSRYIGSLVGDFHRTMLYGGIYGYPSDRKSKNGKLRLLYECAPMSFIAEQAGGSGSTGTMPVLDVHPEKVHQRVPLFIGSKKEVEYLESYFKKAEAAKK